MTNKIEEFLNDKFGTVRATKIENLFYFVAKDVADVLQYSTTQKVTDKVHDNSIIKLPKSQLPNLGNWGQTGGKDVVLINESGLYSLILKSKQEEAKKFKRWVTSEVLPTIRKTGGYVSNEQSFIDMYLPFADDATRLMFGQTLEVVRQQNEKLKQQ